MPLLIRGTLSRQFSQMTCLRPQRHQCSHKLVALTPHATQAQATNLGTASLSWSSFSRTFVEVVIHMPYLAGVLTGVLLTILAVFVIDHVKTAGETSAG